jgi:hypothetical protein
MKSPALWELEKPGSLQFAPMIVCLNMNIAIRDCPLRLLSMAFPLMATTLIGRLRFTRIG